MALQRSTRVGSDGTSAVFIQGINRGMVFWADVPAAHTVGSEQQKRRPWLVVSTDNIHQKLPLVIAVPLSTKLGKASGFTGHRIVMPLTAFVPNDIGAPLNEDSVALTEQVRALSHARLDGDPAGRYSEEVMRYVSVGLRYVLRLG